MHPPVFIKCLALCQLLSSVFGQQNANIAIEQGFPGRTMLSGVTCNDDNPCPYGYACMYNPSAVGVKSCFSNVPGNPKERRPGRCPRTFASVVSRAGPVSPGKVCMFHIDCTSGERCCDNDGTSSFFGLTRCVRAERVPAQPNVIELVPGTYRQVRGPPSAEYSFTGSVALVQSNGRNIIFDTGNAYIGPKLIKALQDNGLTLDDIDMVINSHGHPDHYSNNGLFPDVTTHFSGFEVDGDSYKANPLMQQPAQQEFLFNDRNLEMINTPGHTPQDTSLIVRNVPAKGTVILTGDTVMDENDYKNQVQSTDLIQSRQKVVCDADWILPGHGSMFLVTPEQKNAFGCPQFG